MKNVHEIEIKLEGKDWETCLDNAFKKVNKEVEIDGFRKGNAPKEVFLKKYGYEALYNDAINEGINIAYEKLLNENSLQPVIQPSVDITGISDGSAIFKFTIITRPEVKLSSYKNLGVKLEKAKVTKEDVEKEIEHLRSEFAEVVVKENGTIVEGDTAVIDFDGYVDGKAIDGGKGENYPLEIGSHTFIPGFEEGLIGKKTDEEVTLNLTFPENYTADLKGKDVVFNVKIHEIKTRVLPEIDEDFFNDLGMENVTNNEELDKEVKKTLIDRKQAELEDKFVDELLLKASEKLEVEINKEIVSEEVHHMIEEYERQLKMQGLSLDQYMEFTKQSHEDLHKMMEPQAIQRIKYRYVIEEIANKENVDFTDEEVKVKAEEMANNYGIKLEELIQAYGTLEVVKYDMKMHRALELLKESNK